MQRKWIFALLTLLIPMILAGCGAKRVVPRVEAPRGVQKGLASYYHDSLHGNRTASGEIYDRNSMTAAHRTLPFGTKVRVKNLDNGRTVVLRINDRGPFVEGRIIDVSRRAARELDFEREGVVPVRVEILGGS